MKTMRLHGINRDIWDRYRSTKPNWYYEVVEPGFKYNMSDLMAAIGIHQLRKTERFQQRREAIATRYNEAFADLALKIPFVANSQDTHAWHLYVIQLELERLSISRDEFIEKLIQDRPRTKKDRRPTPSSEKWAQIEQLFSDPEKVALLIKGQAPPGSGEMGQKMAKTLAKKAPLALAWANEIMTQGAGLPLDQGLKLELERLTAMFQTKDALEGLSSFMERRPPRYQGA